MFEDQKYVCVYHDDCADGFAAAYCFWKWAPNATFYPAKYNITPIPQVNSETIVVIVDFSFPPEELKALADSALRVFVLDHHKSAIDKLKDFEHPNVCLVLDTEKSGSMLAWENFQDGEEDGDVPPIVRYTNDYDLWRFRYGDDTKAFVRYLYALKYDFGLWDTVGLDCTDDSESIRNALAIGKLLLEDDERKIAWHLENSVWEIAVGEYKIPIAVVNVPRYLLSETCNRLARDYYFVVGYQEGLEGRRLRFNCAEESDAECNKIAELFGGGGHVKSAGALVDRNLPWETVRHLLSKYMNERKE